MTRVLMIQRIQTLVSVGAIQTYATARVVGNLLHCHGFSELWHGSVSQRYLFLGPEVLEDYFRNFSTPNNVKFRKSDDIKVQKSLILYREDT